MTYAPPICGPPSAPGPNFSHGGKSFSPLPASILTGRLMATIIPDGRWPGMYRVKLADGTVTDMVNRSRAADAARVLALRQLSEETASGAATVRYSSVA